MFVKTKTRNMIAFGIIFFVAIVATVYAHKWLSDAEDEITKRFEE